MVLKLFPHQSKIGTELGTGERFKVGGFEKGCAGCRGEKEQAHPLAQIYGRKRKLDRYYWREIKFSYLKKILAHLDEEKIQVEDIFDFEKKFPDLVKVFKKEAKAFWRKQHQVEPLYEYQETSQDDFFEKISPRVSFLTAEYRKEKDKGLWVLPDGRAVSAEKFVAEHYKSKGYRVHRCERKIVSTLVGAFFWTPICEPDENLEIRIIGSRGSYSKTPAEDFDKHGGLWFYLPKDFGSKEFFNRKEKAFIEWMDLLQESGTLLEQYDYFLGHSKHLRDYLWVHNDEAETVTREFLKVIPDSKTFKILRWAIEHFWDRQPGWPDLFMVKGSEHLFVEVKGHKDKISPDQMQWFSKVVPEKMFESLIVRLRKA